MKTTALVFSVIAAAAFVGGPILMHHKDFSTKGIGQLMTVAGVICAVFAIASAIVTDLTSKEKNSRKGDD